MTRATASPSSLEDSIQPVVPLQYIQSIRLVHALAESSFSIALPAEDIAKFALLTKYTGVRFQTVSKTTRPLRGLHISHSQLQTRIGEISRPLIFPRAIIERCRGFWHSDRPERFTFAGLVTERRLELLRTWIDRNLDLSKPWKPRPPSRFRPVMDRVRRRLGCAPAGACDRLGPLLLWSSTRGREFPGKAWDEEYFKLLSRSQFVLCPSGDFVWSYRFFEAVLCGATPIVEASCAAYEGFRYHSFGDNARNLAWKAEDAEANFSLALTRLTIPVGELNAELRRLLPVEQYRREPTAPSAAASRP